MGVQECMSNMTFPCVNLIQPSPSLFNSFPQSKNDDVKSFFCIVGTSWMGWGRFEWDWHMGMSYLTSSIQLFKNIAYVGSLKYFSVEIHFTMYFLISLIPLLTTYPLKVVQSTRYLCTWLVSLSQGCRSVIEVTRVATRTFDWIGAMLPMIIGNKCFFLKADPCVLK